MEGQPLDDTELVKQARQGDRSAFDELVRRYQELAFRTAYHVTGGAAEAEDAAQEAFVKAYLHLDRFRLGTPFRPWLLTIVANEARNRRVASARRAKLAVQVGERQSSDVMAPSPEAVALSQEQHALLLAILRTLREEERLAVAFRYFLDLSEAEMARVLRCPRGTVKSRLSRGLHHLRDALDRADASGEAFNPAKEEQDG